MTRLLLLALLLNPLVAITGAAADGKIFRTTDSQGNVIFTDTPPAGAGTGEEVQIQQINTAPPPAISPVPARPAATESDTDAAYSVSITSPANKTSIPMGPGNFSVTAKVQPSPGADQSLQLYIDEIPWGKPQQAPSWALTNVYRGAHDLTVAVVDGKGKQLANSKPLRVYVHRPSINFRNR